MLAKAECVYCFQCDQRVPLLNQTGILLKLPLLS